MSPQPRIIRTNGSRNGGAPVGEVTPEEAAVIRSSVGAREQAPSTRVQSIFSNWREVADQLGDPFEVEKIPVSKLRAMRRDPMLGFGLSFTKTPHVRAKWTINAKDNRGPNPQVAAHLDHDWRRIHASFVMQYLNCLEFGFQAIAKRFEFRTPSGTYIDNTSESPSERPIWSEGGIQPIAWKPFVALRPEGVDPIWDRSTGEFSGIEYTPSGGGRTGGGGSAPAGTAAQQTSGGSGGTNREQTYKIDLPHSLWVTNEKDANFGSVFGYPRLGYAYRYWWSYWMRWAIADRAFERKADPSVLVYHPEGEFLDEDTGQTLTHSEYALMIGERMRSGGVIAMPSEVFESIDGRGTIRQWQIEFTKDSTNFDPFDKSFEYLDVQKLRSLFIPEQAFLEGKGGTSSRNVAAEMGDSFVESQAVLNAQIVETINRWIIPQWLAVNYPEFVMNGGTAEIMMQGFGDEDVTFMNQLITLIGQQESGMREILKMADLRKMLEDRGAPIANFAEQQRRERQLIEEAQAAAAPAVAPAPGRLGVVPTATGFSYVAPREIIYLSETATSFIDNLPDAPQYEDRSVRQLARQLWNIYADLYRDEYLSAIDIILNGDDNVEMSDFKERAKRLLEKWTGSERWASALDKSISLMTNLMRRAARIELTRVGEVGEVSDEEVERWLREHLAEIAPKIAATTRGEVESFLAATMESGVTNREELAQAAREHFSDFPQWKADRLVRTEVRDIYNAATLLAAEAHGIRRVQAVDAQVTANTDEECVHRDGRIFAIRDAFEQREHPNGTLGWRMVPAELSIERRDVDGAEFDERLKILTLSNDLPEETENRILKSVVDVMLSA
jgi:hypothetical protein